MFRSKAMKKIMVFSMGAIILSGATLMCVYLLPVDLWFCKTFSVGSEDMRWKAIRYYEDDLEIGMSHSKVARIMPRPDFKPNQYIWIWAFPKPKKVEVNISAATIDRCYRNSYSFVMFDKNGRLIAPLLGRVSMDPWSVFEQYAPPQESADEKHMEDILGGPRSCFMED
jgi:hypothetical protein